MRWSRNQKQYIYIYVYKLVQKGSFCSNYNCMYINLEAIYIYIISKCSIITPSLLDRSIASQAIWLSDSKPSVFRCKTIYHATICSSNSFNFINFHMHFVALWFDNYLSMMDTNTHENVVRSFKLIAWNQLSHLVSRLTDYIEIQVIYQLIAARTEVIHLVV